MLSWFLKYGAFIYIINTILFSITGLEQISNSIFYGLMITVSFIIVVSPSLISRIVLSKRFSLYLCINLINLCYYLFFELGDLDSFKYLISRFIGLTLFSISIELHTEFYKKVFFKRIVQLLFIIGLVGLFISFPSTGRYQGIMGNSNEFATEMSIAFGFLHILTTERKLKDWLLLLLFSVLVIISGSRGALLGLFLPFLIKERINFKTVGLLSIFIFSLYSFSSNLALENSFSRFFSEQNIWENRINEYQYAIETIKHKWIEGNGLSKSAYINQNLISAEHEEEMIGSHNGYLAILIQYGFLFGTLFFGTLIYFLFKMKRFVLLKKDTLLVKLLVYIILYAFLGAIFETTITGINNFHTAMFWFTFGLLYYEAYDYYQLEEE